MITVIAAYVHHYTHPPRIVEKLKESLKTKVVKDTSLTPATFFSQNNSQIIYVGIIQIPLGSDNNIFLGLYERKKKFPKCATVVY